VIKTTGEARGPCRCRTAPEVRSAAKRARATLCLCLYLYLDRHPIEHAFASCPPLFYNILFLSPPSPFPSPSFSHPLHVFPPALPGLSCPCRALIYSSHILQLPSLRKLLPASLASLFPQIDYYLVRPSTFLSSNCIGFVILNSFVLPHLASHIRLSPIFNVVSMPIEVTSSPSITDTLRSYSEYSYQPSLFAKISRTGPANNWIIHEQPIAMEDAAADVSSPHRSLPRALSPASHF
jgi:hypothetical protein